MDGSLVTEKGSPSARIPHTPWTLAVARRVQHTGQTRIVWTELTATFRSRGDFRLTIHRRHLFHRLAELVGGRDVIVGRRDFDRRFTVRSTSPARARSILLRDRTTSFFLRRPGWSLEVGAADRKTRKRLGDDVRRLRLARRAEVRDEGELSELVAVGRELLEQLARLGSASRERVEVEGEAALS